jgi:hypothetical protein
MLILIALSCLAVMTGNELCVALFVNPLLRRLPEARQTPVVRPIAERLGRVMPFWYFASLLLTAFAAYESRQWKALDLPFWSAILQAVVVVLTVTLLVPINNRLSHLRDDETGWTAAAERWDHLHQLRVVLLLAAVALLAGQLTFAFSTVPPR